MDLVSLVNDSMQVFSNFQVAHPQINSMLTAEATFLTGDAVSQLITDHKVDTRKLKYTAALAPFYGLCINGLIESGELVGRYVSESPIVKSALGPNLWGNLFNTLFFVNNSIGEQKQYRLQGLARHYKTLLSDDDKGLFKRIKEHYLDYIPKKEYLYSVIGTLSAWNVIQGLNYSCVPEDSRTTVALMAGLAWTTILSAWSLKGRKNVVNQIKETK
jgi:hypothetical protein